LVGANASVLARISLAKVSSRFTVATHPSGTANAVVVVDELDTLLCSQRRARIGKTFVDISLTSGANVSGWTFTFVSTDFIDTNSSMMAGPIKTLVDVDFAKDANGSMGTSAFEIVDQIVADSIVLARVGQAVIDVVLTVLALKSWRAVTLVSANEISTSSSILTGIRLALIDFLLAVAALVAISAHTLVLAISNITTVTSVSAKLLRARESRINGGGLAGHLPHIAKLSSPTCLAIALEGGTSLNTTGAIFTR